MATPLRHIATRMNTLGGTMARLGYRNHAGTSGPTDLDIRPYTTQELQIQTMQENLFRLECDLRETIKELKDVTNPLY